MHQSIFMRTDLNISYRKIMGKFNLIPWISSKCLSCRSHRISSSSIKSLCHKCWWKLFNAGSILCPGLFKDLSARHTLLVRIGFCNSAQKWMETFLKYKKMYSLQQHATSLRTDFYLNWSFICNNIFSDHYSQDDGNIAAEKHLQGHTSTAPLLFMWERVNLESAAVMCRFISTRHWRISEGRCTKKKKKLTDLIWWRAHYCVALVHM